MYATQRINESNKVFFFLWAIIEIKMDKEQVILRLRHDAGVIKDFLVRNYHRFADYLAEKNYESQKNGCFAICGMRCTKYVFIVMNIFYVVRIDSHMKFPRKYPKSKCIVVDVAVYDSHGNQQLFSSSKFLRSVVA